MENFDQENIKFTRSTRIEPKPDMNVSGLADSLQYLSIGASDSSPRNKFDVNAWSTPLKSIENRKNFQHILSHQFSHSPCSEDESRSFDTDNVLEDVTLRENIKDCDRDNLNNLSDLLPVENVFEKTSEFIDYYLKHSPGIRERVSRSSFIKQLDKTVSISRPQSDFNQDITDNSILVSSKLTDNVLNCHNEFFSKASCQSVKMVSSLSSEASEEKLFDHDCRESSSLSSQRNGDIVSRIWENFYLEAEEYCLCTEVSNIQSEKNMLKSSKICKKDNLTIVVQTNNYTNTTCVDDCSLSPLPESESKNSNISSNKAESINHEHDNSAHHLEFSLQNSNNSSGSYSEESVNCFEAKNSSWDASASKNSGGISNLKRNIEEKLLRKDLNGKVLLEESSELEFCTIPSKTSVITATEDKKSEFGEELLNSKSIALSYNSESNEEMDVPDASINQSALSSILPKKSSSMLLTTETFRDDGKKDMENSTRSPDSKSCVLLSDTSFYKDQTENEKIELESSYVSVCHTKSDFVDRMSSRSEIDSEDIISSSISINNINSDHSNIMVEKSFINDQTEVTHELLESEPSNVFACDDKLDSVRKMLCNNLKLSCSSSADHNDTHSLLESSDVVRVNATTVNAETEEQNAQLELDSFDDSSCSVESHTVSEIECASTHLKPIFSSDTTFGDNNSSLNLMHVTSSQLSNEVQLEKFTTDGEILELSLPNVSVQVPNVTSKHSDSSSSLEFNFEGNNSLSTSTCINVSKVDSPLHFNESLSNSIENINENRLSMRLKIESNLVPEEAKLNEEDDAVTENSEKETELGERETDLKCSVPLEVDSDRKLSHSFSEVLENIENTNLKARNSIIKENFPPSMLSSILPTAEHLKMCHSPQKCENFHPTSDELASESNHNASKSLSSNLQCLSRSDCKKEILTETVFLSLDPVSLDSPQHSLKIDENVRVSVEYNFSQPIKSSPEKKSNRSSSFSRDNISDLFEKIIVAPVSSPRYLSSDLILDNVKNDFSLACHQVETLNIVNNETELRPSSKLIEQTDEEKTPLKIKYPVPEAEESLKSISNVKNTFKTDLSISDSGCDEEISECSINSPKLSIETSDISVSNVQTPVIEKINSPLGEPTTTEHVIVSENFLKESNIAQNAENHTRFSNLFNISERKLPFDENLNSAVDVDETGSNISEEFYEDCSESDASVFPESVATLKLDLDQRPESAQSNSTDDNQTFVSSCSVTAELDELDEYDAIQNLSNNAEEWNTNVHSINSFSNQPLDVAMSLKNVSAPVDLSDMTIVLSSVQKEKESLVSENVEPFDDVTCYQLSTEITPDYRVKNNNDIDSKINESPKLLEKEKQSILCCDTPSRYVNCSEEDGRKIQSIKLARVCDSMNKLMLLCTPMKDTKSQVSSAVNQFRCEKMGQEEKIVLDCPTNLLDVSIGMLESMTAMMAPMRQINEEQCNNIAENVVSDLISIARTPIVVRQQQSKLSESVDAVIKNDNESCAALIASPRLLEENANMKNELAVLQRKYEKLSGDYESLLSVAQALRTNEATLKKTLGDYENMTRLANNKYEILKEYATNLILRLNDELGKYEAELQRRK